MTSFLIIDNYPTLRTGIANLLKNHFRDLEISELSSADDILQRENNNKTDLIILGINDNAKKKDLSLYNKVKLLYPATPIIIYDEIIYDFKTLPYLEFGIEGYLLKQNDPSELIRAVELVLSGKRYVCNAVLQNLFNQFLLRSSFGERK
ncbi:response regulator [Dyadobacter subterraneus]|uniref:Response regulator transcription factor n=1 Tax=Dyadobacter subterraneus TaxID=2773304 RepID=A0ABR9WFI3_9BACT|nr:response regulator [Dyadobacter subterraneus]MBE9464177.1 response regulator transcription factor [Dyadobacter subterraneus]